MIPMLDLAQTVNLASAFTCVRTLHTTLLEKCRVLDSVNAVNLVRTFTFIRVLRNQLLESTHDTLLSTGGTFVMRFCVCSNFT
jgi:hypothetical protein